MHVLFAANLKKGSSGDYIYLALKRLGHKVTVISPLEPVYEECVKVPQDVNLPEFIKNMRQKPDLFLFADCSGSGYFFPEKIADLELPTAWWALDNHLNFRWHKEWAGLFDYVFFTQYDWMMLAAKCGAKNLAWLPYAGDEVFHKDFKVKRDIDIGYVGSVTDQKKRYFRYLEKEGLEIQTNDRVIMYEDVGHFYSRCKIVYNLSARYDLNHRSFEPCIAGALVIGQSDLDEGFYKIFRPGVNCDVHNFDNAAKVIRGYLDDPEKLNRVAAAGQKLVTENHTYTARLKELFKVCGNGVTNERKNIAVSYMRHVKSAMTYQHPQFRLHGKAWKEFQAAMKKSLAGTCLYLFRYLLFRIYEKSLKTRYYFKNAPH